jgi:hypothetical protein
MYIATAEQHVGLNRMLAIGSRGLDLFRRRLRGHRCGMDTRCQGPFAAT